MVSKFVVSIEGADGITAEQLEELVADAMDGWPETEGEPIVVSAEDARP